MLDMILEFVRTFGLPDNLTFGIAVGGGFLFVLALAFLSYLFMRYVIVATLARIIMHSESTRDDTFARMKVFSRLSHTAPAMVVYALGPALFAAFPMVQHVIETASLIYLTLMIILFIDALMSAGLVIYNTYKVSKTFPITSFVQIAKMLLYFFGAVTILALVLNKSPFAFFAGLGAMTAVLMLVFKDPILGFVAGVQLSTNKMVSVGDWIEMPKFSVDGDIIEIGLTTVKIRNFDKTVTTIPTQSLINDSFKNWRGMQETGGRRIKRAVHLDVRSVKFCDAEMLERFSRIQFIADYITSKKAELSEFNSSAGIDTSTLVNGRHMTNLGTFRAYVEAYLRAHPQISDEFTFLVRQLKPTEHGLPIEVYVFTTTTNWLEYEAIQADIFDHLLAAAPEFDLRLFQNPTGSDFARARI
jgi:miniconductance mechanosensitive channel